MHAAYPKHLIFLDLINSVVCHKECKILLGTQLWRWQENVTDSVPCPVANFGISGVESSRFISTLKQITCSRTQKSDAL
jgi:hypothetical protein